MTNNLEKATLAGGCFWCTEAIFKRLKGVESVLPGYAGGHVENPNYDDVSDGITGHAEAIQIEFDPKVIPYKKLLEVFWHTHNPTTLNRQGNDVGTQYRSEVFYHTEEQKNDAEQVKAQLEKEKAFRDPIVTEITKFTNFYVAENYHKDYFEKHPEAPYCSVVIDPKVKKLLDQYGEIVKPEFGLET